MKILAALSGGVDSAVSAARLVQDGHEVIGVHLALNRAQNQDSPRKTKGCCTLEDAIDASVVCDKLGIPFYVWDFSWRFKEDVIDDFIDEYKNGRTPNPCLRCNEKIKFSYFLEKAILLGFDAVATGHWAKVIKDKSGDAHLYRSPNIKKDQSYVLGVLRQEQLKRLILPLGLDKDKEQIRQEAAFYGFSVSSKPDSYDICFIPDGNTQGFLRGYIPPEPGVIKDISGNIIGSHTGVANYTIGQRKGLNINVIDKNTPAHYVLSLRPKSNEIIVGQKEDLAVKEIYCENINWCYKNPFDNNCSDYFKDNLEKDESGTKHLKSYVQIRSHGSSLGADIYLKNKGIKILLHKPCNGVSPGQSAVIYNKNGEVLGQGKIMQTF